MTKNQRPMLSKQSIAVTSSAQKNDILSSNTYSRNLLPRLKGENIDGVATIISGIRRCGKSTLLGQALSERERLGEKTFYLNFDTPALYGFALNDFTLVDELLSENGIKTVFLDEVQVVDGWEVYVRSALDKGLKVYVTGSNAHLLSSELGTKLTGRHISYELFPFSYSEFCGLRDIEPSDEALLSYLNEGGMPKYLLTGESRLLEELVSDILYRDIAVRHKIRDERALRAMLSLLMSNVGNLCSASKLKSQLSISSTTTVSEYLSFFQQSYLFEFVPKFSYSVKAQIANPKKVYCIDNGIVSVAGQAFSANNGRKLENAVYLRLRENGQKPYYFNDNGRECDFITTKLNIPNKAIQVCFDLNAENESREIGGLITAMKILNIENGQIVTFNQRDSILSDNMRIEVIPFTEF